jgi:thiopeptide-type bacteriocin biosynthesis protein
MSRRARPLYEPTDFFVVRAPLLPLEAYLNLHRQRAGVPAHESSHEPSPWLVAQSKDVRRALAVGSVALLDAEHVARSNGSRRLKVESKLLRYMIRMSTRPTPFGLFAGVAMGRWGDRTDLALSVAPRRQRTRPDMAWLMKLVIDLESIPEVRRHLRVVANSAALIRAGRVFLAERVSRGEATPPSVSIRATSVVRRALLAAREPITLEALASFLLADTPGATPDKVDKLLTELWQQTLLLTDLRPPLTVESPARYVLDRLANIPAAAAVRTEMLSILEGAARWDGSAQTDGADGYRRMVAEAARTRAFERSPFQVDSAVQLAGERISRRVGEKVAVAAEILLRLSPFPRGPAHIAVYRRLFAERYGTRREVPLVELLDPNFGLGPPLSQAPPSAAAAGISRAKAWQRAQAMLELATHALHERRRSVDLDEAMMKRLETWEPSTRPPTSLDVYVSVAATSKEALDAGDFLVVVEPNVGALGAGRTLGRFADLLPGSREALARAAASEEARTPRALSAELAYQPRLFRLGNVSIRPNVRTYEVAVGVTSGREPARTIPLDELVVGIRDDRFYVRWPAAGQDVAITAGHMLRPLRAPAVCRFLSDVGRDGCCQLSAFQWGAASTFPFLPRIQIDGIVLALAQWRFAASSAPEVPLDRPDAFYAALQRWCAHWQVPQHVYLTAGDNRLLLDLTAPEQADEIRRVLQTRQSADAVLLTEVFPDFDHIWVRDVENRPFITELVVPLISSRPAATGQPALVSGGAATRDALAPSGTNASGASALSQPGVPNAAAAVGWKLGVPNAAAAVGWKLHPLGSEWLFAKLYGGRALEDDLLAGPLRRFAGRVVAAGLADEWFCVRYSDPERHLRVRFRGDPQRLLRGLVPLLCEWTNELIREGSCRRSVLDTYEQEVERFGGPAGMRAAETLFAADSQAVVDLLELLQTKKAVLDRELLAVMTVDALLDGFGLDMEARFRWCRGQVRSRQEASREYRHWKGALRTLLADADAVRCAPAGSEIAGILERLRSAAAALGKTLRDLESTSTLTRPASELYQSVIHLHLNRLLGGDSAAESRVIGLLWRVREGLHRSRLVR